MTTQELEVYYNRYWKPLLRHLNDGRLVWFNGKNYFFLDEDAIYTYAWKHVWWLEGWIIRDLSWSVLAFGENVTDSPKPFLPFRQFKPFPSFVEFEPFRPFKEFKKFKPLKNFYWSKYRLTEDDNDK